MRSLKARVRRFLRHRLGIEFGSRYYFRARELVQDLGELIDRHRIDAILDVGANRGQFRHLLRRNVGYRGLILSFEPVRACIEALRPQVARDPRWFLYEQCSSFLDAAPETHGAPLKHAHDEEVSIRALESVFPELKKTHGIERAYLKLDTQGYDLEVIHGAGRALREFVALQAELSFLAIYENMPDYATVLAELTSLGFDVSGFYPAARDEDLRTIEFDCLLVRSNAVDL
ncbi:MAG: FkbM family methyltransferase [Planctomycetota bacterium]